MSAIKNAMATMHAMVVMLHVIVEEIDDRDMFLGFVSAMVDAWQDKHGEDEDSTSAMFEEMLDVAKRMSDAKDKAEEPKAESDKN